MISIKMDEFIQWFESELDKKYADKLQSIKRLFIVFFNLSSQIIILYAVIKQKMQKHNQKDEYKQLFILLNNSILVLSKIIQNKPKYIDYSFCQKFIKNFDMNLNLLCTFYHSLNHINLISQQTKFQKDKIVDGINKLYTIENKIKQIFRGNSNVSRVLALVNQYKKLITTKIQTIKRKTKECQEKQAFIQGFQPVIVQFYQQYISHAGEIQPEQQYKKKIIKMYFQLKYQLFSSQLALQTLCKLPLQICQQTLQKKKGSNYILQQNCSIFSRWVSLLLKANYSSKNLKKIKIQQLIKSIQTIVKQFSHTNNYFVDIIQKNIQDIRNLIGLVVELVKQLEKLEHSGLANVINQYKDALINMQTKKYFHKILQYQVAMAKYHQLEDQIKKTKTLAQTICLQELSKKVNILINEQ